MNPPAHDTDQICHRLSLAPGWTPRGVPVTLVRSDDDDDDRGIDAPEIAQIGVRAAIDFDEATGGPMTLHASADVAGGFRGRITMQRVNLAERLSQINEYWRPKVVGELNGQEVKLVKFKGEFVWHQHAGEDELFLVVRGAFRVEFRDRVITLEEGEFVIVPRGVEHRTVADAEVHVLIFEPAATRNTGNVEHPTLTAPIGDRL